MLIEHERRTLGQGAAEIDKDSLEAVIPSPSLQGAFLRMALDYQNAGETRYAREAFADGFDYTAYVARLLGHSRGIDLPQGFVRQTTFWLVDGTRADILGTSRLRHFLNASSKREGGHIGYDVPPSRRNKGMATELLRLTLGEARKIGIYRVLVTCDQVNAASARVIEKCGGKLDNQIVSSFTGRVVSRYWINN